MKLIETQRVQISEDFLQWPFYGRNTIRDKCTVEASWFFSPTKMLACQMFAACFPSVLHRGLPLSFPPPISLSPCQKQFMGLHFQTILFQCVKWTYAFCKCTVPQSNSKSQYYLHSWIRTEIFQVSRKKKHRYP